MGKMDGKATEKTGEWGFCARCGNTAEVVVVAQDRLRFRLVRAVAIKQARAKAPISNPLQQVRHHLTLLLIGASSAQALANHGLVSGDAERNRRSAVIELCRRMREITTELAVVEANLAAWLGQPIDLLREATEELEHETDGAEVKLEPADD